MVGPFAVEPLGYWIQAKDWVPGSDDFPQAPVTTVSTGDVSRILPARFERSHATEARKLIRSFEGLSNALQAKLLLALDRLNNAKKFGGIDRAIDLGIALEALLLDDRASSDPVSLLFRLRGAWLMNPKGDSSRRKELYDLLDDIYAIRSTAVHTGKIKSSGFKTKKKAGEILETGTTLCSDLIKRIIQRRSLPDKHEWDRVVLDCRAKNSGLCAT